MMRRLTSAPKPAARVLVYIAEQVVGLDAQAVAHAVEAREVGRRLGGGDHVVGGQRVRRVRQRARLDLGAQLLGQPQRRLEGIPHAGLDPLAGELLGDAEADAP